MSFGALRFTSPSFLNDTILQIVDLAYKDTIPDPDADLDEDLPGYTSLLKLNSFASRTWKEIKDIIWNYHFDETATFPYDTGIPASQPKPYKNVIRVHSYEHTNAKPPTGFHYIGPYGETFTGTWKYTWDSDGIHIIKSEKVYNATPAFYAFALNQDSGGPWDANITGIIQTVDPVHGARDIWQGTWATGTKAGNPIPEGGPEVYGVEYTAFNIFINPVKIWGPIVFIGDGAEGVKDKKTFKDYTILNKIHVNYRSLVSDNVHSQFDDDLPVPTYRGDWEEGNTYYEDDQVVYEGEDYYSLYDDNKDNIPATSPGFWTTEKPGERHLDQVAQIISGIYYDKTPWGPHVAWILDGIDSVFLSKEFPDNDYRLKPTGKWDPKNPNYDPDAIPPRNPFGLKIDDRFMRIGDNDRYFEITQDDDKHVKGRKEAYVEEVTKDWPPDNPLGWPADTP